MHAVRNKQTARHSKAPSTSPPQDARTLLKTPKRVAIVELCGGQYVYFSIASCSLNVLPQSPAFPEDRKDLCINIDGIPLFNSSNLQVWPILCSFHAFAPFIVALYWTIKTSPVQDDLSDFLQQDGIFHGGKTLQVTLKAFICDTPS